MGRPKDTEFTGEKGLAKMIEEGVDPNADLMNEVDQSSTKAQAALALAMHGAAPSTIADMLGYSSAYRARQAVERVLASSADSAHDRDKMRELNKRRYDRLLQSVMPKAINPKDPKHLDYNARALAIIDRIGKLYGVDAAQQVQITATDERIQEVVQRFAPMMAQQNQEVEADIIDADIVEDEGRF